MGFFVCLEPSHATRAAFLCGKKRILLDSLKELGKEKKNLIVSRQKEWNIPFGCAMGSLE